MWVCIGGHGVLRPNKEHANRGWLLHLLDSFGILQVQVLELACEEV